MSTCVLLIVCAWSFVRLLSVPAAVVMSVLALLIPPIAAITANAGRERGPWPPAEQRRRR